MNTKHYVYLLLLFYCITIQAQSLHTKKLNVVTNGGSNTIKKKMLIDSDGFLWYSTHNGIVKYIGNEHIFYPYNFKHPLDHVNAVFQDSQNIIWVVTDHGILYLKKGAEKFGYVKDSSLSVSGVRFTSLIEDNSKTIWLGTSGPYVAKLDESFELSYIPINKNYNDIRGVNLDDITRYNIYMERVLPNDKILARQDRTLFVLENNQLIDSYVYDKPKEFESDVELLPELNYNGGEGLLITDNGALFPKNTSGTYSYLGRNLQYTYLSKYNIQLVNIPFKEMLLIRTRNPSNTPIPSYLGSIDAAASNFRLYVMEQEGEKFVMSMLHNIKLPTIIRDVVIDHIGKIYISASNQITKLKFSDQNFEKFLHDVKKRFGEKNISTRGMIELSDESILVASYSGVFKLNHKKTTTPSNNHSLKANRVTEKPRHMRSFVMENDSVVWAAGDDCRIYLINTNTGVTKKFGFETFENFFFIQYLDAVRFDENTLLLASNYGLMTFNTITKQFKLLDKVGNIVLRDVLINDLYKTDNTIYIATETMGLVIWDSVNNTAINMNTVNSTISNNATYVTYEDTKGRVWVGTDTGVTILNENLNILPPNKFSNYLKNKKVVGILQDEKGVVWCSTYNGLFCCVRLRDGEEIISASESDGLPMNEFNKNSHFKSSKGKLYFGGINGLVAFDSIITKPNRDFKIFQVALEYINKNDVLVKKKSDSISFFKLGYSNNYCSFKFATNNIYNNEGTEFLYKLVGFNKSYQSLGNDTTLRLFSLPPGKYTVQVKAVDALGIESTNILQYTFEVEDIFYNTLYFKAIALTVVISSIVFVFVYSSNKQRKKYALNLYLLELELKTLRSQMNPHFVFNALKNIKHSINAGDKEGTSEYINNLATLIRLTLDVSRNEKIALSKEFDYIKAYIQLENFQRKKKINLDIQLNKAINPDEVFIPSMIIQPNVENAIRHGFIRDKAHTISIAIDLLSNNKQIQIIILDDGIGINQATEQNNFRGNHKSHALQILKERFNLFNKAHRSKYDIVIEDLSKYNKQGTKVTMCVTI